MALPAYVKIGLEAKVWYIGSFWIGTLEIRVGSDEQVGSAADSDSHRRRDQGPLTVPGSKGRAAYRTMSGGTRAGVGRVVFSPGSTLGGRHHIIAEMLFPSTAFPTSFP